MNEQIRQLLNEATSGHEQEHDRSKVMTVSDKEMEKFAELIVRECITICQHNADDDDDQFDLGRVHQAKEITHLIKKHFVVEL